MVGQMTQGCAQEHRRPSHLLGFLWSLVGGFAFPAPAPPPDPLLRAAPDVPLRFAALAGSFVAMTSRIPF